MNLLPGSMLNAFSYISMAIWTVDGSPIPVGPSPAPGGAAEGFRTQLEELALSHPAVAEVAAAMQLQLSLPLTLPLTVTLPALSMDLEWTNEQD